MTIVTSFVDPVLNSNKWIIPGLGDFGKSESDSYVGSLVIYSAVQGTDSMELRKISTVAEQIRWVQLSQFEFILKIMRIATSF